jgi:hypothetical protein
LKTVFLIHKNLHTKFHSLYGYRDNTVEQFIDFIKKIAKNEIIVPISSQPASEGSGGLETRVFDPERIRILHERLSDVKNILDIILSTEE